MVALKTLVSELEARNADLEVALSEKVMVGLLLHLPSPKSAVTRV